jgi:hypothetical protein
MNNNHLLLAVFFKACAPILMGMACPEYTCPYLCPQTGRALHVCSSVMPLAKQLG